MLSPRLTLNNLISLVVATFCLAVLIISGRVIVESIQKAKSIDEKMTASTAPQLNRQGLEKALQLIVEPAESPEGPQPTKPSLPEASSSGQALPLQVNTVEVINASGVTGAAKTVAALFGEKTQVELKNNQVLLDETTLIYKNEYKDQVSLWKTKLEEWGWTVAKSEQRDHNEKYDVTVVLGKKQ